MFMLVASSHFDREIFNKSVATHSPFCVKGFLSRIQEAEKETFVTSEWLSRWD